MAHEVVLTSQGALKKIVHLMHPPPQPPTPPPFRRLTRKIGLAMALRQRAVYQHLYTCLNKQLCVEIEVGEEATTTTKIYTKCQNGVDVTRTGPVMLHDVHRCSRVRRR